MSTSPAPAFLGIDLGTTNSVAVLLQDDLAAPVRNADGAALLPSVVRLDARGQAVVGARARKFLEADPENARSEFKRLMGSDRKLAFRAAKTEKTPEELSALVLSTLRASAERVLGYAPTAAVITVPALFELPQTRATSEAARLAGFERVEHLQEPVASALTAGWNRAEDAAPWLVYDLGGGTFDVSLLETREGVLRVVDHDGDNFLGGSRHGRAAPRSRAGAGERVVGKASVASRSGARVAPASTALGLRGREDRAGHGRDGDGVAGRPGDDRRRRADHRRASRAGRPRRHRLSHRRSDGGGVRASPRAQGG